ncbi:hypothetical protein C0995_013844 [Termitomyces sp. Mi166|nr:hypothetical protein C0995_013844 [Termitomyces sp. Mi166\
MKLGHALTYALRVFQRPGGVNSFVNWEAFETDFQAEFFLLNPAKTAALSLHNPNQYGQEEQSLDDYINSFHALAEQAGYPDGLQLCLTFCEGLHPTLMECIDNLAEGHPDNSIATWYKVAHDQWQLMELKHELQFTHPLSTVHASSITPPPSAAE